MTSSPLVTVEALAHLPHLHVAARAVVEGLHVGIHRSPYKGQSVDFADHRPYVAGDDIRHLDWKVLGRSDRMVLRRYEAETDLACLLVVDASSSMSYQGQRSAVSKYRYAAILAATLAHVVVEQQDRAGLHVFAEDVLTSVPAGRLHAFERICQELESCSPAAGTDPGTGLRQLADVSTSRGLVVCIGDFLDNPEEWAHVFDRLRHRGHTVACIWVLDPDEIDLGIDVLSRFEGLELGGEVLADPRALREAYQAEVEKHKRALSLVCRSRGISLVDCLSSDQPGIVLQRLLRLLTEA